MNMRNDSPFAKLTKAPGENLLELSKKLTADNLVQILEGLPEPIRCSIPAIRRFLRRVAEEQLIDESGESEEVVALLAKKGENLVVRDATLATVRQRMFENAVQTDNRELLMKMFRALNEEKADERSLALEERKVKVAEENAKLGWRKLECENARAGLKLLPKVREVLMDATKNPEARVAEALACFEGRLLVAGLAGMLPIANGESREAA